MASEIFGRVQLIWDYKANPTFNREIVWRDAQLTASRYNQTLYSVGTSWEAVEIGDLSKTWMIISNLDDTNYVSWGKSVADATELIRIPKLTAILIYSVATAPAMQANTSACDVEIIGVEGNS